MLSHTPEVAEIESRLAAGRVRGRDGDQRVLSLPGALSLYLVNPCWYPQDMRESWVPQRPEPR